VGDPRLIPLGVFLRSSGLDEWPQIINILRGEMSWVGPRPSLRYEYGNYEDWQMERLTTPPGITGLWQVSGKNKTTFLEMVSLDIYYARKRSLWLDLKILWKTPMAILLSFRESLELRRNRLR
jgi:lipopolysaccharide/colanic/teichoic acid biosynthesis glycosyltransferase